MILVLEKFVVYFNDFDEEKKTFPLGVPSNPLLQEMELETEKSTQLKASCTLMISLPYLGSRCFDLSITLKKTAGKSR